MFSRAGFRVLSRASSVRRTTVYRFTTPRFASSTPNGGGAQEKFLTLLETNHDLKAAFEEVGKLMHEKGFDVNMGVMQQMKFLMDSEVRQSLKKVGSELQKSGVEFNPAEIQELMKVLQIPTKNKS